MQFTWLNKHNSNKLIIFFNGWSLDENIINHLNSTEYDVLMFYDYTNLEIPQELITKINSYKETNIIAWSFGVWACGAVINNFSNLKKVIAINGTLVPIDNNFGISEKMFNLTLSNLSEITYPKFFKNMFLEEVNLNKLAQRKLENQKQELTQIQNLSSKIICDKNDKLFNKIFIGLKDKIIPAKNQLNFWKKNNHLQIIQIENGHYIFDLFNTWDEILNYA